MPPIDLPRGNAAKPAPRPAPAAPPPTSLRTSNNPRGVAIVTPRQAPTPGDRRAAAVPARAIQTFHHEEAQSHVPAVQHANELRGQLAVAGQADAAAERHQAALHLIQIQHNLTHTGTKIGGSSLSVANEAAIHAQHLLHPDWASFIAPAKGILGHLGSDIVRLPESTVQGLWYGGKAAVHDVSHPLATLEHPTHSALAHLAEQAATSDPLFNLLTLHPGRALKLAEQHPLGAVADLGAAGGLLGRVAGVGSRAAGVGERLAPVAREARSVVPADLPVSAATQRALRQIAPVDRRYSPNLLTAAVTRARDRHSLEPSFMPNTAQPFGKGTTSVPTSQFDREMFRRANEHHLVSQTVEQHAEHLERQKDPTGLKPLDQRIREARNAARRKAKYDLYLQNGLVNPRTGNILWAGGKSAAKRTRAMDQLGEQGYDFTRVALPRSMTGAKRRSVIVPKTLHETLTAHETAGHTGIAGSAASFVGQRFRRTVLPYSTKWILGNTAEAGLRTGLRGIAPWHAKLAVDLIKEMHNEGLGYEAARLQAQALQGTHFAMQQRHAAEYSEAHPMSRFPRAAKGLHAMGKPADLVFKGNQGLEQAFAHATLGKYLATDLRAIAKAHPNESAAEHLRELAHMYAEPSKATAAGRYGRTVLGKYGAFGPDASNFVRKFAPFAPWYFNSLKFMGTLPGRHPTFTAGTQDIAHANAQQWAKEHKAISGIPGSDTIGFPMTGKYKALDISRFIPPGAFTPGTALHNPINALGADLIPILGPQWADAYLSANGLDPFGNTLQYPGPASKLTPSGRVSHATVHLAGQGGTDKGNVGLGVSDILLSLLGGANATRRVVAERGETPYSGTDNIFSHPLNPPTKGAKPPLGLQGILAGLNKVFNPIRPVDLQPRRKRGSSHSSSGSRGPFGGGGSRSSGPFGGGSKGGGGGSKGGPFGGG